MATVEERVSRLEGAYDHLATKADLAALESKLTYRMASLQLIGMGVTISAVAVIVRFLG